MKATARGKVYQVANKAAAQRLADRLGCSVRLYNPRVGPPGEPHRREWKAGDRVRIKDTQQRGTVLHWLDVYGREPVVVVKWDKKPAGEIAPARLVRPDDSDADAWIESSTAAELAHDPRSPYRMVTPAGQRFGLSTNDAIRAQRGGLEYRGRGAFPNPSRSPRARASRAAHRTATAGLSRKIRRAATTAARRPAAPGNAAKMLHYWQRSRARKAARGNPSGIPPTVDNFVTVLSSKLTQYDQRQSKRRGHSPHALAHYMGAVNRVRQAMRAHLVSSSPAALATFVDAMNDNFDPLFPPVKAVAKQVREYLESGRRPSLIRNPGGKGFAVNVGYDRNGRERTRLFATLEEARAFVNDEFERSGVVLSIVARNPGRALSVPEKHQLKIARDTLRMSDAGARIMGGMTKAEARDVIERLTGKRPNPSRSPRARAARATYRREVGASRRITSATRAEMRAPRGSSKRAGAGARRRFYQGHHAARRARRNPGARRAPAEVARAAGTFRKWHGFDAHKVVTMTGPQRRIPATLVKLGELPEIVYTSNKWEGKTQTYVHRTSRPRPVLATDPTGRDLFIVGGKVRVTADGLVG